jgi:hypothetical protein
MTVVRAFHAATLLPDGKILISGGIGMGPSLARWDSAELYDPASGTFSATDKMTAARARHVAALLPNNKVLVANSEAGGTSAELYDPVTGLFSATGSMKC